MSTSEEPDSPEFSFSEDATYENPARHTPAQDPRAVALNFDEESDQAPRVTAKGSGELARKILQLAEQENIPLYRDRDLVELLYRLDLEEEIPASLYEVVAEIFAFLYRLNQDQKTDPP